MIDIFKQPMLFGICQGLVAMVKNEQKEISLSPSPPLSFMFLHSHSLQAYTLVPNASISNYQDITHSLWLFLGLLMKAEFVEFECKASW